MKARIQLNSRERKDVQKYARVVAQKQIQKEREKICRQLFKLSVCVLNEEFGFGAARSARFIGKVSDLINESFEDEIFWEHRDRLVIDRLGLPFERDYTR